jgi:hypothetical protein
MDLTALSIKHLLCSCFLLQKHHFVVFQKFSTESVENFSWLEVLRIAEEKTPVLTTALKGALVTPGNLSAFSASKMT